MGGVFFFSKNRWVLVIYVVFWGFSGGLLVFFMFSLVLSDEASVWSRCYSFVLEGMCPRGESLELYLLEIQMVPFCKP